MLSLVGLQVSLLERQQVQQQRTLAGAHYSHAASTPSAVDHNCISYRLCDHRGNVFDRENDAGDVNVCARGDRMNGFDVVLGRRCWKSRFGIVLLRVSLLLLADDVLLVCFSDVGL